MSTSSGNHEAVGRCDLLSSGGMIVRKKVPLNLEIPFGSLGSFVTPVERFYARGHFPIPELDVKSLVVFEHQERRVECR